MPGEFPSYARKSAMSVPFDDSAEDFSHKVEEIPSPEPKPTRLPDSTANDKPSHSKYDSDAWQKSYFKESTPIDSSEMVCVQVLFVFALGLAEV